MRDSIHARREHSSGVAGLCIGVACCSRAIAAVAGLAAVLVAACWPGRVLAVDDVYMFSYFKDPDGLDGLHLAYTLDGQSFHPVNADLAITGPMVGTTTRDPCINLGPDGKFHLVHTTEPWNTNSKIAYGESTDLITWTNRKYIDVMAAYPNTQRTWAPELFYDTPNNRYVIYWSADIGMGTGFRTYYTTTSDYFSTFTPTTLLYDPGRSVIDAMIVKDGTNHVMFVKDEQWNPNTLYVYKAQGGTLVTGTYASTGPQISPSGHPFEGPTAIKIGNRWYLYGDYFTDVPQKMGLFTSDDGMATWTERTNQLLFPPGTKHGTIFKVPRSVVDNLISSPALTATREIEFDGHAGSNDYMTAGNWLGNAVPGTGQVPVIQTGHTVNLAASPAGTLGGLYVGRTSSGTLNIAASAALNISGEVKIGGLNNPSVVGVLKLSGGTINSVNSIQIANGAVRLDAGTLLTPSIFGNGEGSAGLIFNGGALKARNSTNSFITGVNTIAVENGGAVIDTNGYNVAVPQALLSASATGGLTKTGAGVLTLTAANTYNGPTIISQGTLRLGPSAISVAHRWSFNSSLLDSVGNSDAVIVDVGSNNVTLSSSQATLTGGARNASDYIRLGSNLLPDANTPVTIELWATPQSVQNWSRIFDFGSSNAENLFMSWTRGTDFNSDRVEWKDSTTTTMDNTNQPYNLGVEYHIVMVLDPLDDSTMVTWYSAAATGTDLGAARGSFVTFNTLASLNDSTNNLGRSFYSADATANASYNEVRIWNGALSQSILEALHDAGPNADLNAINYGGPGLLPANTAVSITASGATLDLNGVNQTIGSLAGVPGSQVTLGSAVLTTGGDNSSTTFAGNISGTGSLVKVGTGTFTLGGNNSYTGGTTVNAGTLNTDTNFSNGTLTIAAGATARVNAKGSPNSPGGTTKVPALNLDPAGRLDLTNNSMIIDYSSSSPLATVQALLASGYNSGGWNGNGIITSLGTSALGLGYAEASALGVSSFGGQPVDSTAVLIKFTYMGDSDLDGDVDNADFGTFFSHFQQTGQTWFTGDFDYDGDVDNSDFGLFFATFNSPPLPSEPLVLGAGAAVPEPGAMGLIGLGLTCFAVCTRWTRKQSLER